MVRSVFASVESYAHFIVPFEVYHSQAVILPVRSPMVPSVVILPVRT